MAGFYPIRLIEQRLPDGSTGWLALHDALPGCNAAGRTEADALVNLEHAREAWLAVAAQEEVPVEPPMDQQTMCVQYLTRPEMSQCTRNESDPEMNSIPVAIPA